MKKLRFLYYFIAVSLLASCGTDDNEAGSNGGIVADFSFTVDENDASLFTFTNLSKGATSYRWDFGDLNFYCEKENPRYRYTKAGGEIEVTLTAMNESGQENYVTKTISAPVVLKVDIAIDGKFNDWAEVPVVYDESGSGANTMQKIKMWGGGDYVNVYIEGNTSMKMEVVDMYINADANSSTGLLSWQWPVSSGADFLIEGAFLNNSWGDLYKHNDPSGGWGWAYLNSADSFIKSSGVINVDAQTNAIEFRIAKSKLGSLGSYIGLAITEMNGGWTGLADFPKVSGTSSFVIYELPNETVTLCE
jgi:PKD repeat protein